MSDYITPQLRAQYRRPPVVPDLTMADLKRGVWTVIGTSELVGLHIQWRYRMSPREVGVMRHARESGAVIMGQTKIDENVYELKAMLSGGGR